MSKLVKTRLVLLGILLFAFGFPLVGFLVAWRDVHVRIERSAMSFLEKDATPMLMRWDEGELLENSTVAGADRLRGGEYAEILSRVGKLTAVDGIQLIKPRAKETDDQGMMYAGALIQGKAGEKSVTIKLDLRNVTADNEWQFDRIEIEESGK